MLHVAICDDDPAARTLLSGYLARYFSEHGEAYRVSVFESGEEFLAHYPQDLDLLLLDIRMLELSGMDLARRIRTFDEQLCIIFISNMPQYALAGYEVHAFNFLVKPFGYPAFCKGIDPAIRRLIAAQTETVSLRTDAGFIRLLVRDILFAETLDHKLLLHLINGNNLVCYCSMNELEKSLQGKSFFRCHISFLINLAAIQQLGAGEVVLRSGAVVPVSRHRKKN